MSAAPDAVMSGAVASGFRVFVFGCKVFGYNTSKDRGLCERGPCVPFVWLCGVCLWMGVCISAGVVVMVAQKGY